jgi:hypothetical protein
MSYFNGKAGAGGGYDAPEASAPMGCPQLMQNREVSGTWVPQFVQKAMVKIL